MLATDTEYEIIVIVIVVILQFLDKSRVIRQSHFKVPQSERDLCFTKLDAFQLESPFTSLDVNILDTSTVSGLRKNKPKRNNESAKQMYKMQARNILKFFVVSAHTLLTVSGTSCSLSPAKEVVGTSCSLSPAKEVVGTSCSLSPAKDVVDV